MWKEILQLFKRDNLCQEAFKEAIQMLDTSKGMFNDAVASLRTEGCMDEDIYERDQQLNKFERDVRRKIVTHLAISTNPDVNMALLLTSVVVDIERIGDYTKNIVELAADCDHAFKGGEIEEDINAVENILTGMFDSIIPALQTTDVEKARRIFSDHEDLAKIVEQKLRLLSKGTVLVGDTRTAVIAALYIRYLKRISAHLKNVATSVINPYHRIGFREKDEEND